ncbi:hypothetical protein K525DRAFT_193400, partial [Schizophyllum commune Loenen D]
RPRLDAEAHDPRFGDNVEKDIEGVISFSSVAMSATTWTSRLCVLALVGDRGPPLCPPTISFGEMVLTELRVLLGSIYISSSSSPRRQYVVLLRSSVVTSSAFSLTTASKRSRTAMPTRYTAEMKLAGLAVQSVLMGLYITLVVAMIYLLSRSPTSTTKRAANRRAQRLLIIGMAVLSTAALGQWTCLLIRAFKAFIFWEGGTRPYWFYFLDTGSSEVTRSAFHSATIITADLFVILRLWVVWNYRKRVIIAPALSLSGLLVSGAGTAYAYAAYETSAPATLRVLHLWKMAHMVLTICTNLYCTGMIIWRIGRLHRQTANFALSRSIVSFVTLMAESAAVYTSLVLAWQVSYGMKNAASYFIQDCIPPSAALAAVLVHARAILSKGLADQTGAARGGDADSADSNPGRDRGRAAARCADIEFRGGGRPMQIRVERSSLSRVDIRDSSCMPRAVCPS